MKSSCSSFIFYPRAGEVFLLVVYLECPHLAAVVESFSHADGAVAAECSHLKNVARAYHRDKHLEKPALKMSARHAAVNGMYVGGAVETVEIIALSVDVTENV